MATSKIKLIGEREDVSNVLTTSYATTFIAYKVKIGNFVIYTIRIDLTSEVPANTPFISGIESPVYGMYGAVKFLVNDGKYGYIDGTGDVLCSSNLASGSYRFSFSYVF